MCFTHTRNQTHLDDARRHDEGMIKYIPGTWTCSSTSKPLPNRTVNISKAIRVFADVFYLERPRLVNGFVCGCIQLVTKPGADRLELLEAQIGDASRNYVVIESLWGTINEWTKKRAKKGGKERATSELTAQLFITEAHRNQD